MTIEARLIKIENNQKRILALLHKALGNTATSKWISYEEARKVIGRSKSWFQKLRTGLHNRIVFLEGKDWRKFGNEIEYYLPSLETLKEKIVNKLI